MRRFNLIKAERMAEPPHMHIQDKYGEVGNLSYDRLRIVMREAWVAIGEQELQGLLLTIHGRCQAIIDVNGIHVNF